MTSTTIPPVVPPGSRSQSAPYTTQLYINIPRLITNIKMKTPSFFLSSRFLCPLTLRLYPCAPSLYLELFLLISRAYNKTAAHTSLCERLKHDKILLPLRHHRTGRRRGCLGFFQQKIHHCSAFLFFYQGYETT
jgi:hypothetical protein